MYRNNTVSVIELVAAENLSPSDNFNSPEIVSEPSVSGNEADLPLAVDRSSVNVSTETIANEKTESDKFEVPDKISFKQKMKEILSCRICSELRRSPMYQVYMYLCIYVKKLLNFLLFLRSFPLYF